MEPDSTAVGNYLKIEAGQIIIIWRQYKNAIIHGNIEIKILENDLNSKQLYKIFNAYLSVQR